MNKQTLSLRLYQLVILLLTPILLMVFLIRSVSQKEYRQRLPERFGWVPSKLKSGSIIVHAASVGEVIAIKPFVDKLIVDFPEQSITVTTFTPTGSAQVIKSFANQVQHCYIPLDISFCVHLFLKLLKPKAVVIMETELWPTLIQRCFKSEVPLLLINGRLSATSMRRYKKLTWLITPTINKISAILCQSDDNAEHFIELGADPSRVTSSGNLKYDINITETITNHMDELRACIDSKRQIIVVGSTHDGEEGYLFDAYQALKPEYPDLLLLIVPRHPERFLEVERLCKKQGLNTITRSSKQQITTQTDVWLIDTLGELVACYGIADLCVVAGSFSTVGGHNPLEPALFAKPIVVGTNMANFKAIQQTLQDANAIVTLKDNGQLSQQLHLLLADPCTAQQLGERAFDVVTANQGATAKSIKALQSLL